MKFKNLTLSQCILHKVATISFLSFLKPGCQIVILDFMANIKPSTIHITFEGNFMLAHKPIISEKSMTKCTIIISHHD